VAIRGKEILAAILNDDVVVVGGHGAIIADLTAWGWITLILGAILVLTGFGLLTAQEWARWTAVFFATINAIAQIGVFPAAPLWAFIVILLDVLVIYNPHRALGRGLSGINRPGLPLSPPSATFSANRRAGRVLMRG
jgi:hypothetical protein